MITVEPRYASACKYLRGERHGDLRIIDAISRKYTGKELPWRKPEGRVVLVIEVEAAKFQKLPFKHTPPRR